MKKRILMVCLGNICRSPMAKGILVKKLEDKNITWVEVDSAGTADYHVGGKADQRTIENGLKHGIDLSSHRGRQFASHDFDTFDQIYVMDSQNYSDVLSLATTKEEAKKVKLILDELNPEVHLSVPDPWFGGEQGFENVFILLDKACDIIVEELQFKEKV